MEKRNGMCGWWWLLLMLAVVMPVTAWGTDRMALDADTVIGRLKHQRYVYPQEKLHGGHR